MATTVYTVPEADLKVRYREPYLSAALNEKFTRFVPTGIYEGFSPTTNAAALKITLTGSTGHLATVNSSLDAAPTDPTYQVSVHLPAGNLEVNLTAYASKTVAVVLEASYTFPSTTAASVRVYDLGAESVPVYAATICQVVVPASGLISRASILLTGRTLPWATRTRDGVPFTSVVQNGSFQFGAAGSFPPFWEMSGSTGSFAVTATTPPSGNGNVLTASSASLAAQNRAALQYVGVPIKTSRGRIRFSLYFNRTLVPASGNPIFALEIRRPDGDVVVTTPYIDLTTTGTYTKTIDLDTIVVMPARGTYLAYFGVYFNSAVYGAIGTAFYVSDISVELEAESNGSQLLPESVAEKRTTKLTLADTGNLSAGGQTAAASYNYGTNTVALAASAGSLTVQAPYIYGSTALQSATVDTQTGVTMAVGGTTQTGLTVGRDGATTLVRGSTTALTSISATNINIGAASGSVAIGHSSNTTTVSSGTTTLNSSTVDVGAVSSGTTTVRSASAVVNGTANVVGNFSVNTNKFQVTASSGDTLVAGTLGITGNTTATGAINANGGIGRSLLGTLSIGNDASVLGITIGKTLATGEVGISSTGRLTKVYGNFEVVGTATLGTVTVSGIDSATAGGTVTVGATNAGTITLGNAANTATINLGNVSQSTATIRLGNAPNGGSVTTEVGGNSVYLGNTQYVTNIFVGTTNPATSRAVTVGANNANQTTTINGGTLTVGGSSTATAQIANSASTTAEIFRNATVAQVHIASQATGTVNVGGGNGTTGPALVQVGGTTSSPAVINTTLQGDIINLGTNTGGVGAGVKSLVIGRSDIAGVVRFNRYIDGNSTQLDIGTTAQTTGVNLGRAAIPTVIHGSIINIGDAVGVTSVGIGANAGTAVFGFLSPNVGIGSGQTAAGSLILIGNDTAGNNTTTSIQGDTVYVATNAGTNTLVLGNIAATASMTGSTVTVGDTAGSLFLRGSVGIGSSASSSTDVRIAKTWNNVNADFRSLDFSITDTASNMRSNFISAALSTDGIYTYRFSVDKFGRTFSQKALYAGTTQKDFIGTDPFTPSYPTTSNLQAVAAKNILPPAWQIATIDNLNFTVTTAYADLPINYTSIGLTGTFGGITVSAANNQFENIPQGYYWLDAHIVLQVNAVTVGTNQLAVAASASSGITKTGDYTEFPDYRTGAAGQALVVNDRLFANFSFGFRSATHARQARALSGTTTTTLQAIEPGTGSNNITLTFATGGPANGTLTKAGGPLPAATTYTFTYQSGVTTASDFWEAVVNFHNCDFRVLNAGLDTVITTTGSVAFSSGVDGNTLKLQIKALTASANLTLNGYATDASSIRITRIGSYEI